MRESCQKFLCDQMLIRLGRWLRAAGYDTVTIEEALPDTDILQRALSEKRLLLTRDRHFNSMKGGESAVIYLESNTVEACAQELSKKVAIDWLLDPFSRCLLCNEKLKWVGNEKRYCTRCHKQYWEGSHTKRMRTKLKKWNEIK